MHVMPDYWRLKSGRTGILPVKIAPYPPLLRGDSHSPFLKGDTGGFVVMPSPPYIPGNDKSTPRVTEALQTLRILRKTMKRVNEA